MQNELPVYEAIGGAAKMTAQYAADYANWMDKGKTETEATALAASSMRNAQAQAISSAQQSTQNMQQQNELLQAGIGLQGIKQIAAQGAVQEQQTFNDVLANTGDKETALNASLEQRKNIELKIQDTRAKANASVNELTRSMEQQTELVIAQQNGTEATVRASQAYDNAIHSGADATAAAALSAATLTNELTKAGIEADKMAQAVTDAVAASIKAAGGANNYWFGANANGTGGGSKDFTVAEDPLGIGWTPVSSQFTTSIQQAVDAAFGAGGVSAALTAAKTGPDYTGAPPWLMGAAQGLGYSASTVTQYLGPYQSTLNDKISNVDALTQLQNAQTTDKGAQIGNLQTELAWLQTLPESLARDQKIVSLQQSIDQLKTATDANTAATLATLNPLYSQGHGALAIGYYHAASGLDMIAHGPTSGDQVPFHAMVNGGERIQIGPAANSNNSATPTVVNNSFVFNDTNTNNARRSRRQFAQGFRQTAAAMR